MDHQIEEDLKLSVKVEIPETLIKRLQGLGPHFCLVKARAKDPSIGGKGWHKSENLMFADDPRLQEHLKRGGNYGVVGGFGLIIVDIDLEELKQIVTDKLPETFKVQSPGSRGWHLYYLANFEKPIRLRDKDGVNVGDVQGLGKMVVAPGSVHPTGGIYQIVDDRVLTQVTRAQLIKVFKEFVVPDREVERVETTARQERRKTKTDLDILQTVPLSSLNKRGSEYFGAHPVHGSETGQNFWVNPHKNCWHCFRHGSGGGPLLWLAVEEGVIDCAEAGPGALRGEVFKRVLKKARERGLIKEPVKAEGEYPFLGQYFDEHHKFVPKLLADEIMESYHFVTMMDNEEIYVYMDGYYQPYGEVFIKKECKERLLDKYRKNRATEVIDYIKISTYAMRREEPPNLIPLENGVLDLNTMELKPYSPNLMFFNKIPVNYNPEADCPNIKKFHEEITGHQEDATILEEILGFCLYRDYFVAKALMLVGGGANGKSTWLALAKRFLGVRNVSGRGLQDLEEHRFAKADLHTKLANIYADLPGKALQRTGMFKMLTGRDLITAERKFQNSFHFVNYSKLMFSANKVPEAYDDTNAFFRRWIIIVFPNVFVGDDADPYILEKLTTEEELSGLLNLALKGLKRLQENGVFSYSKTTEEIKEDYIRKSSPLAAFVMDCLETDSDAFIVKKELYNVFAQYCRKNSIPTVTQDTFYKNLPRHVVVADYRPVIHERRFHTFKGVKYGQGVSNLSNVPRVFYTLIEKKTDFREPWVVEELQDESYIKVGLPLDRLDTLDTPTTCWMCHKPLPTDLKNTTVHEGKTCHIQCYKDLKAGRKRGKIQ